MNRKFRELIPLFAIGLMIIGAVSLLIIMNMDSSQKANTKLENTKKENKEEVRDEEEENKIILEEETSEPVVPIKDKDETKEDSAIAKTENSKNEVTENIGNKTNISVNDSAYIESMVSGLMNNSFLSVPTTNTTDKNKDVNTNNINANNTNSNVNNNTSTNNTTSVVTKPTTNHQLTQSKNQKIKATAYTLTNSVNLNGYTVATTTTNNIIAFNSSSKVITSTLNSTSASHMKAYQGAIYTFEPSSQLMKRYSLNNGVLRLTSHVNMVSCQEFLITNTYVFILKNDSRLYAYKINGEEIEQAQSGFVMESGGITSISQASGSSVTVEVANGKTYKYTFNGINFIRK